MASLPGPLRLFPFRNIGKAKTGLAESADNRAIGDPFGRLDPLSAEREPPHSSGTQRSGFRKRMDENSKDLMWVGWRETLTSSARVGRALYTTANTNSIWLAWLEWQNLVAELGDWVSWVDRARDETREQLSSHGDE